MTRLARNYNQMLDLAQLRCVACGGPACPDLEPNPAAVRIFDTSRPDLVRPFCSPECGGGHGWPWLPVETRGRRARAPAAVQV